MGNCLRMGGMSWTLKLSSCHLVLFAGLYPWKLTNLVYVAATAWNNSAKHGFLVGSHGIDWILEYALPFDATQYRALVSPWPFERLDQSLRVGVEYGLADASWAQISILPACISHRDFYLMRKGCNPTVQMVSEAKRAPRLDSYFGNASQWPGFVISI